MRVKTNEALTLHIRRLSIALEKLTREVDEMKRDDPLTTNLTDSELSAGQNYDTYLWELKKCT
jgi:hypothetical protein